jgi:transposase
MSKPKYYPVVLAKEARKELEDISKKDGYNDQQRKRARILLALDESQGAAKEQAGIADVLKVSVSTVHNVSRAFCEGGIIQAISRKRRMTAPVPPKVDGEVEAKVIAMACSKAPDGHARWTLRLLEDRIARIGDMPKLSDNTIGRL